MLESNGWERRGRATHGVFLYKHFSGELMPRSTVVPDKTGSLPDPTLGAILSVKQTGLGRPGLQALLDRA